MSNDAPPALPPKDKNAASLQLPTARQGTSITARRNFKNLTIPSPAQASNSNLTPSAADRQISKTIQRKRPPALSSATIKTSSSSATLNSGLSSASTGYSDGRQLTQSLAALELGLEFKLDLHLEDLKDLKELGYGNGGIVTMAQHIPTKTIMAKKTIHVEAREEVQKRILRELQISHDCASPYIVSFYGAFKNNNDICMCMEYMDCGSLDRVYKKIGRIPVEVIGKIILSVLEGLIYLYNVHRIIHRDVKPSNILLNTNGQVKLCDFGVSGELINSIANTFVGTSTYMSPERIQGGQYAVKSDIWSLGISLWECAAGKAPYRGGVGVLDLLQQIVGEEPPELPPKPDDRSVDSKDWQQLTRVIGRCLVKDVDKRPLPQELMDDPFVLQARDSNVDMAKWAQSTI